MDDAAARHWQARLDELCVRTEVVGASLALLVGEREAHAASGVLSTATGVPATPDALFQVGSITKVWTGSMVMQLVEEGRLTLDATVADVLPGVRLGNPDASGETTVRHLLTHTSGIDGDIFTDTGRGDACVERYVAQLADARRTHPVGAAYSYCNSGFVLLGRILEVLDARTWDESLRVRLIEPLGLTETVTLPEDVIPHRAAMGHRDRPDHRKPVERWGLPRSVGPAGLIVASARDVVAFAAMHLDGGVSRDGTRLLGTESVAAMQAAQRGIPSAAGRDESIGLAWRLSRWGDRQVIGHDGGTIGQLAYLRADPAARVVACLLTNSSVSASLYEQLFTEIFQEYVGAAPPPAPDPIDAALPDSADGHVGRYERTSVRHDVTRRDGVLHVVSQMTEDRALFGEEEPEEYDLHPVDETGNAFVARLHEADPWTPVMFGTFPDGTPYHYSGGRTTPKVA